MKKLIALLLVITMILSFSTMFTACEKEPASASQDDDDDDDDTGKSGDSSNSGTKPTSTTPTGTTPTGTTPTGTNPTTAGTGDLTELPEDAKQVIIAGLNAYYVGKCDNIDLLAPKKYMDWCTSYYEVSKADITEQFSTLWKGKAIGTFSEYDPATAVFKTKGFKALLPGEIPSILSTLKREYHLELPASTIGYTVEVTINNGTTDVMMLKMGILKVDDQWLAFEYAMGVYVECYGANVLEGVAASIVPG